MILTEMHILLLQRGERCRYIGLADNSGLRMAEITALAELKAAGYVADAKGPFPPGPPSPTPHIITDAGRTALAASR